jgi:hypothetical protein
MVGAVWFCHHGNKFKIECIILNVIFEGLFSLVLVSRCDCLDGEDDNLVSSKSHPALILSRLCLVWHC